jgi:hypothetical protein
MLCYPQAALLRTHPQRALLDREARSKTHRAADSAARCRAGCRALSGLQDSFLRSGPHCCHLSGAFRRDRPRRGGR